MDKLLLHPLRVYGAFAILIAVGIWSYVSLPVAMYPSSTKPKVNINVSYGMLTAEGFLHQYGKSLEYDIRQIHERQCTPESTRAHYGADELTLSVEFHWGDEGRKCLHAAQQVLSNQASAWPEEIRRGAYAYLNNSGTGFFFGSFHSAGRSPQEIFDLLEKTLQPQLAKIREAQNPQIWNPNDKQILIELRPQDMAAFKLLPRDVVWAVSKAVKNFGVGTMQSGSSSIKVEVGSQAITLDFLAGITLERRNGQQIRLSEISEIKEAVAKEQQQLIKIDGQSSVGLYVQPAPGQNIKAMSDKILAAVEAASASGVLPKDIQFSVSINPAELIEAATNNVMKEVWLCSLIAVLILFLFIGNIAGTFTALIEIPTSLLLAFILMKLSGVELNLISLGGLALSVGMNVDASIVVIDHLTKKLSRLGTKGMSPPEIARLISEAVREVAMPVFIATCTSLLVFFPLVFTSDLTYAILGDLAKAVIYSHGLSLIIALVLVPTVRLHLASRGVVFDDRHVLPLLGRLLNALYRLYARSLSAFIHKPVAVFCLLLSTVVALFAAVILIPPRLRQEIIGKPDTQIIGALVTPQQITQLSQLEETVAKFEREIKERLPGKIKFTFANFNSISGAFVAIQLNNKRDYKGAFSELESAYKGRLDLKVDIFPWNPSELPIPDPPDWRVLVHAHKSQAAVEAMDFLQAELQEAAIVDSVYTNVNIRQEKKLLLSPYPEFMTAIKREGLGFEASDLADIANLAQRSMEVVRIPLGGRFKTVSLTYPHRETSQVAELIALPVPVGEVIVPIKALASAELLYSGSGIERLNDEQVFYVEGKLSEKEKERENTLMARLHSVVDNFTRGWQRPGVSFEWVNPRVELEKALNELLMAIAISLGLIFLVLFIQFNHVVHVAIVMLAIPFGFLGVLLSLFVFGSSLSLNSALGLILLNGITVANSILLVEMILRLVRSGRDPASAITLTAEARIRPILMTSLITIMGMLPLACGFGEGGKVLQPLGIAVCGGLWVSLIFTLYLIPALEFYYLRRKPR